MVKCKRCKYWQYHCSFDGSGMFCHHETYKNTTLASKYDEKWMNKNGDCSHYTPRWYVKIWKKIKESIKSTKRYCINCKYFHPDDGGIYPNDACLKVIGKYDTAVKQCKQRVRNYTIQNKNNDCKYYKRIWWKFWR